MQNVPSWNAPSQDIANADNTTEAVDIQFYETLAFWMQSLLISAILMVCFAGSIGYLLTRERIGTGTYMWDNNDIRDAALIIRSLGFMAFAAGLVERVILAISKLKP